MWGRTILDTEILDIEDSDLVREVRKAFSTKPCSSDWSGKIHKNSDDVSNQCLVWSKEKYAGVNSLRPALCQVCKESPSEIKIEGSLNQKADVKECRLEPKIETDLNLYGGLDGDFEDAMEGDFAEDSEEPKEENNEKLKDPWEDTIKNEVPECAEKERPFNDRSRRLMHVKTKQTVQDINEAEVDVTNSDVDGKAGRQFPCKKCDDTFESDGQLYRHKKKFHSEKSCSECGEKFATLSLLKAHCDSLNHVLEYKCDFCDERFPEKGDRNVHVRTEHGNWQENGNYVGATKYQYRCPLCNESFESDKYALWEHLRLSHRQESVDCKVKSCYYSCVGPQLMFLHNLSSHKKQGQQLPKSHTCEICEREVHFSQAFAHYRKDHYMAMDDGCRFECRHCGEAFKSIRARTIHINEIHLHKTYDCDKCGKSFKRSISQLRQHLRKVHMKESQKKQCQICQEWLANPEDLSTHVRRIHTGEKPFKCVFCEESFSSSRETFAHKRYKHPDSFEADQKRKAWLNENPTRDASEYKMNCPFCSEVRSTITELRQHWEELHPGLTDIPRWRNSYYQQNLICELCGDTKSSNTLLKIHTFEKHDVDKTECPVCLEEFKDRSEAIKHVKEEHKPRTRNCPSQRKDAVCPHCGYVGTKGNMHVHMARMHEKASIRPTSCTYCQKEFPRFHNMVQHRKIAHREQWNIDKERLMVEEGGYKDYKDYLGKYQQRKKYIKKATCPTCGTTLCSRQQLHLHMKALHGTGLPGYIERKSVTQV